ncbi:MAG TPA: hypothetical protein VFF36_01160, partial [Planctomycetota bacterium]|nr:hypothetical protein [Planctomycetota bacterium]
MESSRAEPAVVKLTTSGSAREDSMPRGLKADGEGRAMFSGLAPGHYMLFAEISGGGAFTSANVTAGAATVVELQPRDS